MKVLITGAGGFLGQRLASAFLEESNVEQITLVDLKEPPTPKGAAPGKIVSVGADLTTEPEKVIKKGCADVIYLLHGIMSGGSEANFELGMSVNLDSTRAILDIIRKELPGAIVVFTSSGAVYGGELPEVITESTMTTPQSSYGAEKCMCEYLINDYSRRGWIDGRVIRYPTVIVRPGAPSSATSSFCSGIIREPLIGLEAPLPVSRDLAMWFASVKNVVRNTVQAYKIPAEKFGTYRTVNLPGMTVTVQEMLDGLVEVAGKDKLKYIVEQKDPVLEKIVTSWPARFDTSRAESLGFFKDGTALDAIKDYVAETQNAN